MTDGYYSSKMKNTPQFTDGCLHGKKCFVGSIAYDTAKDGSPIYADVYVYKDKENRDNVCIRYGNESSQYYSPGLLLRFIESASRPNALTIYHFALIVLEFNGDFCWKKNSRRIKK